MTITDIAAQMGVTPEKLVQETISQGTAKATVFVVLGALAIVLAIGVAVAYGMFSGVEFPLFGMNTACVFLLIGAILLMNVPNLIAWKTAPETTANKYIVEHYGGDSSGYSPD